MYKHITKRIPKCKKSSITQRNKLGRILLNFEYLCLLLFLFSIVHFPPQQLIPPEPFPDNFSPLDLHENISPDPAFFLPLLTENGLLFPFTFGLGLFEF